MGSQTGVGWIISTQNEPLNTGRSHGVRVRNPWHTSGRDL